MFNTNLVSQSSYIIQSDMLKRILSNSVTYTTDSERSLFPQIPPNILLYFKKIFSTNSKDIMLDKEYTLEYNFGKTTTYDIVKEKKAFSKNFMKYSNNIFNEIKWDNILISGEFILKCLNVVDKPINSINICIYGLNHKKSKNKIEELIKYFQDTLHCYNPCIIITSHVISILCDYPIKRINIIIYSFINKEEIILSHDIYVNQIGYDGSEIYCSENNIKCILNRTIIYNPNVKRKKKYCYLLLHFIKNGFSINFHDMNLIINRLTFNKRIKLDINKCNSIIDLLYFIKMKIKNEKEINEIIENIDLHLFNALLYDMFIPYKEKTKSREMLDYVISKYKIGYQKVNYVKILLDDRNENVYLLENNEDKKSIIISD